MGQKLASLMEKYRWNWQFIGMEIVDPNQRGAMGDTMLHLAVESGALADVDVVGACGANVKAVGDTGNTPLHSAALTGNIAVARKLLELGADPRAKNEFDQTPADVAKLGDRGELGQILSSY